VLYTLHADVPPLTEDADGALRIGASRVLLEIVIRAFQDGATPETIVQRYPTATLADVYAVISYYLRHKSEIEQYLVGRERQAQEMQQEIRMQQGDVRELRERLEARRQGKR